MTHMTSIKQQLLDKIERRTAHVGIVGLGYVGLPLAVEFARAGFHVLGYDVSERVVKQINDGRSHIQDVPASAVAALVKEGLLEATTDARRLGEVDAVSISARTSSSPSAPSASIRVTSAGRRRTHPRSWVESRPPAPTWRRRCTPRASIASCPWRLRRPQS